MFKQPEPALYAVRVLTANEGLVNSNAGLAFATHGCWQTAKSEVIDTLIVAGGNEKVVLHELIRDDLVDWIAATAASARRVVSICTGAFALGQANLLRGKTSTTHWSACGLLQSRYPEAKVVHDRIFVRDGKIWTSAGILTGIDLALALVEEDLGHACASQIARLLVISGMRSGGAQQITMLLRHQQQASQPIRELLLWIRDNLAEDLHAAHLAERMTMSLRHFNRVFKDEVGTTPSKFVLAARLEHAAMLLRDTEWNIDQVCKACGFDSPDSLQRGFRRHRGVSPLEFRNQGR